MSEYRIRIVVDSRPAEDGAARAERAARKLCTEFERTDKMLKRLGVGFSDGARALGLSADEMARLERRATTLKSVLDPLWGAQDRFNKELAEYNLMAKAGLIDTKQLADAQSLLQKELDDTTSALKRGGMSAGAMRHASLNLGYQINDITSSLALGIHPMTVFAQQGGQVAASLAGMGGRLGAVATFLSGPWGAALLGAAAVVGTLTMRLGDNSDAADELTGTTKKLTEAEKALKEIRGESILFAREVTAQTYNEAKQKRQAAIDTIALAEAKLLEAEANYALAQSVQHMGRDGAGGNVGAAITTARQASRADDLREQLKGLRKELFNASQDADKAFAKLSSGGLVLEDVLAGVNRNFKETKDGSDAATKVLREQEKAMEALADAAQRASNAMSDFGIADAAAMAKAREDAYVKRYGIEGGIYGTGLGAILEASTQPISDAGKDFRKNINLAAYDFADIVGDVFGRKAGGLVKALGLGDERSDFGKAFKRGFEEFNADFSRKLDGIFGGNSRFAETLGKIGGAWAVGSQAGSMADSIMDAVGIKSSKLGAQIGGTIGSYGGPVGTILGSIAGGLLGGVLKGILNPARTARANITGVDDALGLGGKDRKNYGTASDLGASVQEGIRNIADVLGAEIGKFNVTIGVRDKDYRVNTSGTSLKTGKGAVNFGDDAEAALAYAIRDALRDGALKGISEFSQRALRSTLELEQAVDVAAKYEQILKSLNSSSAIEAAAKEFVSGFDSLVAQMRKVGATAEELANVEKLFGIEREKALKSLLDPLLDYRKSLSGEGSGVTAMERYGQSKLEYEQAKSDFASGLIDQNALTAAGQQLFGLARDIFGTATDEFQNLRKMLLADSGSAIDTATAAFNAGASEKLLAAQEAQNTIATQQYQQAVVLNQQVAEMLSLMRAGGGVGLGGSYVNGVWRPAA